MDLKDIHKSKTVRGIIIGLGVAVLVLGIFKLGQVSGYHKARFSQKFGDNFNRNFVDPRGEGFFKDFSGGLDPIGGHGAVGKIVSIALPLIVVAGPDNIEKTIMISESTEIRKYRDDITTTDLKVGDFIVVLGTPNDDGQVEAKLIRTLPPPPEKLPTNQPIQ
ncbi:MAG: DUF5666 domain-containing protein [Candidatus Pacebacteria bacterium]|nr:DUF5666 domain-containing protein [Candidatus Paceibacterota bacterium]